MPATQKDQEIVEFTREKIELVLSQFYKTLLASQVDIDPDIERLVNEHFWELIEE